jgi:hypothetical protein
METDRQTDGLWTDRWIDRQRYGTADGSERDIQMELLTEQTDRQVELLTGHTERHTTVGTITELKDR